MRNLNGEWVQLDLLTFIRYSQIESVQILANRDLIVTMASGVKYTVPKGVAARNDILNKGLGFKLKTNGN